MSVYDSDESSLSHPSSFSDQTFKVSVGTTFHPTRYFGDSENNGKEWGSTSYKRITRHSLTDTGKSKEVYLSTTFSSSVFQKDIYDAGKLVIYPKCMQRMLSSEYPKILSVLEEIYGWGAFIYVGSSFQCVFARYTERFLKIKKKLICDICIFGKNRPAILLTVAEDTKHRDHLISYNLRMKRNLEEWISETCVEFKALSVVVTPEDFQFRGNFKRIISYAEAQSPTLVLPSPLATVILTVETFLRKLATCKFVHRFSGVSEETVYLNEDLFEEFIELMEEKTTKTVYSKCSEYTMLLACELGYRLALIGHTSIHSKSDEKREFEHLRKAQNLSISITYDRNVADENLEEGDVLLSSWKGGVIIFRKEITETAARRTLASGVVNCSAMVQDEESHNELMELVCLLIRRTEEQLKNTLHRADSKYQISALKSFSIYSRDEEIQPYSVGTDAVSRSPTPEIPGFKDSTVQRDLYSQYTDSQTSKSSNRRQMAKLEEAMYAEGHPGYLDHMTLSLGTNRDEAADISSARLSRSTFSHPEDTLHNINTSHRSTSKGVNDQTHLRTWLGTPELNIERKPFRDISHISADQPTHTRDPTNPNSINRSVSEGTHQGKQTSSKQNKNPPEYRCTTLEGEQLLNKEERFPGHQRYTRQTAFKQQSRQPTEVSETANQNEPRPSHYSTNAETRHDEKGTNTTTRPLRDRNSTRGSSVLTDSHSTNTSEQRPSPSSQHRDHANTSCIMNQDASTRHKSINASEQRPSPSYQHRDPVNISYIMNQDSSTRHKSINASEQRPSPSYQRRDDVNTSYITSQDTSTTLTRHDSTNASEQMPRPSYQHRDPANTSYIPNPETPIRHKIPPKHNRNAGNKPHIKPRRGQSLHGFVGESHLTNQGEPKAIEDSTMKSPRLDALSTIPKGIVKRGSIAFK